MSGAARRNRVFRTLASAIMAIMTGVVAWYVVSTQYQPSGTHGVIPAGMVRRQISLQENDQAWQMSPDGRSLILTDFSSNGLSARLVLYDVASGRRTAMPAPAGLDKEAASVPLKAIFSPEGNRLAYLWQRGDATYHLRSVRIDGSDERTLAFQIFSVGAKTSTLMLIPAAGGAAKPLWTVYQPDMFWLGAFAWSRDGRYILSARTSDGKSEIWRVPVDGSAPEKIGFPPMTMMMVLRMNADGKTIAFAAGESEKSEVWILDNLPQALPKGEIKNR